VALGAEELGFVREMASIVSEAVGRDQDVLQDLVAQVGG
jgi:hypothetical protein